MTYGRKGREGPTRGKKAIRFRVELPDGTVVIKRIFKTNRWTGAIDPAADKLIATGFRARAGGKPIVVVWPGEPEWEGDLGRLIAIKQGGAT